MSKRCNFFGRSLHNRSHINLDDPHDLHSTTVGLTVAGLLSDSVTPSTVLTIGATDSSESAEYMQSWPSSQTLCPTVKRRPLLARVRLIQLAVTLLRKSYH